MTNSSAVTISLEREQGVLHGGTQRTRAFHDALHQLGFDVLALAPLKTNVEKPAVGAARGARVVLTKLHEFKRLVLPMPTQLGSNSKTVLPALRAHPADLTIVSALSLAGLLQNRNGKLWIDFMDLWSDFCVREAQTRPPVVRSLAMLQAAHLRRQELLATNHAHLVTAAGWKDAQSLHHIGATTTTWLPNPLPDASFRVVHGPPGVAGFLGNFGYWPNRDALRLLLDNWLPQLTRRGWRIVIAGIGSDLLDLSGYDVEVLGEVGDVDEFYGAVSLVLAPIRLGGGIKVKVVEALARGKTVLGTVAAFEGIDPALRGSAPLLKDVPSIKDVELVTPLPPGHPTLDPYRFSHFVHRVATMLDTQL